MQFNTFLYILCFLPIFVSGYFILNRWSNIVAKLFLLSASLLFYAYAGMTRFLWLLVSIIVNYAVVVLLKRWNRKAILAAGIAFDVILLFCFKYTNFAITSVNDFFYKNIAAVDIVLPIGISFFTFQQIAYIVDSYRGETKEYSALDYLLYVTFFPKILMGPITNPLDLISQFHDEKNWKINSDNLIKGIQMFVIGLFKKVILADTFARAVSWAWGGDFSQITSMDVMIVMFAYTFQIYFDFSGYSDMATGSALMINIALPMNFDSPYKAYSIRDFWKRWHISLTRFLTQYIYIPLGGSKKGKTRTYLNTIIVFLISGFWHGANWTFVLWGLLHGIFSIFDRLVEKYRKNVHPALQWILAFICISILWLLFRADSIEQWKCLCAHMLTFRNMAVSEGLVNSFVLPETAAIIKVFHLTALNEHIRGLWLLLFFSIATVMCLGGENSYRRKYRNDIVTAVVTALTLVFLLTCFGGESVFIYNNF